SMSESPAIGRAAVPEDPLSEVLSRLAAETGAALGDLGVRAGDERWIRLHAEALDSLFEARRSGRAGRFGWFRRFGWLYRLARRAARTAR
ncbi:MAG TPA: hypothetical protein VIZ69_04585, partial [Thermoanaerobaculia bacterium]